MRFISLRSSEGAGFPPPALVEGIAMLGAEATKRTFRNARLWLIGID